MLKKCNLKYQKMRKLTEKASLLFYVGDAVVGFYYSSEKSKSGYDVALKKIIVFSDESNCEVIQEEKVFALSGEHTGMKIKPFEYLTMSVDNTSSAESALKNVFLLESEHMRPVYEYVWEFVNNR